jgi:hypothetical protein
MMYFNNKVPLPQAIKTHPTKEQQRFVQRVIQNRYEPGERFSPEDVHESAKASRHAHNANLPSLPQLRHILRCGLRHIVERNDADTFSRR